MRTKSFQKYIEKRFTKELAKIETKADLEVKILKSIQNDISKSKN